MMTELFYTVWLFFVETKYHVFWFFFFFKNIQVSHILLCSWFWSTLLWFFFLHCLAPVYFHFLFVIIYSSLFFVTVFNNVAACLSECGCLCECLCVCVQCFKNAFNVLNLRISLQYLSSILICKTCICMCTKTSKICKIHTTNKWKIGVYCSVKRLNLRYKGWWIGI